MGVKKNLLKNFFEKNFFSSLNMYQAKSSVKNFSLYWEGGGVPLKKLLRMSWNKFWFWNFWDLMISGGVGGVGGFLCEIQTTGRTDTHHSDQISRSARRDGTTKNHTGLKASPFEIWIIISKNFDV